MAVRLKDVAREAGVAVSTVSNVLNKQATCFASDETRRRIEDAADRLGYQPNYLARGLRRQRTNTIGVVGTLFGSEVSMRFLQIVSRDLRDAGYDAYFLDTLNNTRDEQRVLRELQVKQVDGIIIRDNTNHRVDRQRAKGMPPTVIVSDPKVDGMANTVLDRARGIECAVDWLASQGHRDFMLFISSRLSNATKVTGFNRALDRYGIDGDSLVVEFGMPTAALRDHVVSNPDLFRRPTAILCGSDELAAALIPGLRRIGRRVPDDCSVIGFDDATYAFACDPCLTTLRQPVEELASSAVSMLLALLDGKPVADRCFVPELIVRESAGPCLASASPLNPTDKESAL